MAGGIWKKNRRGDLCRIILAEYFQIQSSSFKNSMAPGLKKKTFEKLHLKYT